MIIINSCKQKSESEDHWKIQAKNISCQYPIIWDGGWKSGFIFICFCDSFFFFNGKAEEAPKITDHFEGCLLVLCGLHLGCSCYSTHLTDEEVTEVKYPSQ